jgi:hypothetical protein
MKNKGLEVNFRSPRRKEADSASWSLNRKATFPEIEATTKVVLGEL